MRILFTAPFWSPEVNSISMVPIYLASQGHDVLIITAQKADSLKGKVYAPPYENIRGAEFFRPYPDSRTLTWRPNACWDEVQERVNRFQPDAIIGFGDSFYRLPLRLSCHFHIPLVMFFEYLRLEKFSIPSRGGGKLQHFAPVLYRLFSKAFRRYLIRQCSAVMFSYYGDRAMITEVERHCPTIRYVPWCTEIGYGFGEQTRNRTTGIYIGSLAGFKNAAELVEAIPLILDQTGTEKFIVVGPGEYAPHIQRLAKRYSPRLVYMASVPRSEAMRLLRSAGYGFTPVADCGLGFIGDCWGTGTPLIATHELDGFLHKDVDTLVAVGVADLPHTINALLKSDELFDRISRGGKERYETNFTAKAVGEKYMEVLRQVIQSTESHS